MDFIRINGNIFSSHTLREVNFMSDLLAKLGVYRLTDLIA
ncbi:hypothetical protein NC653_017155 [Populus alba x Populus x berolinensis]|uniref:Uncharacterized protein n=1 Tax=Populus alba x Populus x berolinensis TaxID=444605 RepID=A0AAD6QPP9_9ROSI|nr:hypothetical protein NC653_017155 [Populus alba x Populus x berolinensis]